MSPAVIAIYTQNCLHNKTVQARIKSALEASKIAQAFDAECWMQTGASQQWGLVVAGHPSLAGRPDAKGEILRVVEQAMAAK